MPSLSNRCFHRPIIEFFQKRMRKRTIQKAVSYTHLAQVQGDHIADIGFIFYYFGTALTWGNSIMIGADCVFLSYWLCWLVAIATAISVSYTHLDVYKRQGRSAP